MSDVENTDSKKKRPETETFVGEGKVEPVPKRPDLFAWLENLFWGDGQFPERLEVRIVRGKDHATMGPKLMEKHYPVGAAKPSREQLVKFSNEIMHRAQQDCDVARKSVVYQIAAIHFSRDDGPYERFLIRCQPGATYKNGIDGTAEDDDDEQNMEKRFGVQILRHHEKMTELHGASFENFIDRQDRTIERLLSRNEQLEARLEKQMDIIQRVMNMEAERESRRRWDDLKIQGIQKSMEMGFQLLPPVMNKLAGKEVVQTQDSMEAITLRNFVSALTPEQLDAVFGMYDGTPQHNLVKPGILTPQQAQLIAEITSCAQPADRLVDLLPDGPIGITPAQFSAIMQTGIPLDKLAPLKLLFDSIQNKKK